MARLPELLRQLEAAVTARGRHRALGARRRRGQPDRHRPGPRHRRDRVMKVKSMATQEIGLNEALEAAGIAAVETDLAELIVQLGRRQAQRTSWCRRSTATGRRSGRSSCARCPAWTRR